MSDKSLSLDSKPHELKFGASFDSKSGVAYHSIRCKISLMNVFCSKCHFACIARFNSSYLFRSVKECIYIYFCITVMWS